MAAAIHINKSKGVISVDSNKLKIIGPLLFLKFSILMAIIVSLTIVKPMAIAAHNGTQKICSFIMDRDDCTEHC